MQVDLDSQNTNIANEQTLLNASAAHPPPDTSVPPYDVVCTSDAFTDNQLPTYKEALDMAYEEALAIHLKNNSSVN